MMLNWFLDFRISSFAVERGRPGGPGRRDGKKWPHAEPNRPAKPARQQTFFRPQHRVDECKHWLAITFSLRGKSLIFGEAHGFSKNVMFWQS
jgi:hypothetical protein